MSTFKACWSAVLAANEGHTNNHMSVIAEDCGSILEEVGGLPDKAVVAPLKNILAASSAGAACSEDQSSRSIRQIIPDLVVNVLGTDILSIDNKREGALSPPSCISTEQLKESAVYDPVEIINQGTCNGESRAHTCDHTVRNYLIYESHVKANVSF